MLALMKPDSQRNVSKTSSPDSSWVGNVLYSTFNITEMRGEAVSPVSAEFIHAVEFGANLQ